MGIIKTFDDMLPTPHSQIQTSILINAPYYFLECVFILIINDMYRLFVIHHNRVLHDKIHSTLKGAKIAFTKCFNKRRWNDDIKPSWTHIYTPNVEWLSHKTSIIMNQENQNLHNTNQSNNLIHITPNFKKHNKI